MPVSGCDADHSIGRYSRIAMRCIGQYEHEWWKKGKRVRIWKKWCFITWMRSRRSRNNSLSRIRSHQNVLLGAGAVKNSASSVPKIVFLKQYKHSPNTNNDTCWLSLFQSPFADNNAAFFLTENFTAIGYLNKSGAQIASQIRTTVPRLYLI